MRHSTAFIITCNMFLQAHHESPWRPQEGISLETTGPQNLHNKSLYHKLMKMVNNTTDQSYRYVISIHTRQGGSALELSPKLISRWGNFRFHSPDWLWDASSLTVIILPSWKFPMWPTENAAGLINFRKYKSKSLRNDCDRFWERRHFYCLLFIYFLWQQLYWKREETVLARPCLQLCLRSICILQRSVLYKSQHAWCC